MNKTHNWDNSESWYNNCVGDKGHYYHESVVLPGAIRLLNLQPDESILDLGCGQGVLDRALPKTIRYTGVDSSKALIADAKKKSQSRFLIADACKKLQLGSELFDAACFILSLQNMEFPELALAQAATLLKEGGRLLIILNHPCFRIPRQSNWGFDDQM